MEISKAIIPAAGLGTGFLPYTKTIPREMLPIFNKPVIQHLVEECLEAEISQFFIITNRRKNAISDYFDTLSEIELTLTERKQYDLLTSTERLIRLGSYAYIRQPEPLGVGHAVLLAKRCFNKEYFGVALPDDLIETKEPVIKQLARVARQEKACVVAVHEVPSNLITSQSIVAIKKSFSSSLMQLGSIVDNPTTKNAPSNLAVMGRYILSPKLFPVLEYLNNFSEKRELSLNEAISQMIHDGERIIAYKIQGTRHDLRTPLGWLKAVLSVGLKNPAYAPHLKALLETSTQENTKMFFRAAQSIDQQML